MVAHGLLSRKAWLAPLLAGGVLVAGVLAGCGSLAAPGSSSGSESAGRVISRMHSAIAAAHSVRVTGHMKQGSTTVTLAVSFAGRQMAGMIGDNGASFAVVTASGQAYIKLDAAFLAMVHLPASDCSSICGRWIELTATGAKPLTGGVSMAGLIDRAYDSPLVRRARASGAVFVPATADGRAVLQYRKDGYTLDVARTGPAYPVLFTGPDGVRIVFSDWNRVRLPAPPAASQVVNLSRL